MTSGSVGFLEDPSVDVGSVVSFFSSFSSFLIFSSSSFVHLAVSPSQIFSNSSGTWDSGEAAGEETVPSSSSASTSSGLSEEIERRSALSMLARAPSRLKKLCWEPTDFFTTLMSLVELTCGAGGGGGGKGAWAPAREA